MTEASLAGAPGRDNRSGSLKRLFHWLRPERGTLAIGAVCMLVLAGTTALAAALVGPALAGLLLGAPGDDLATRLLPRALLGKAWGLPAIIVTVGLVKGLAYFGQFHTLARAGQRTASRLRRAILARLLSASPEYLQRQQTGELLSRFTNDVTAVEMAITYALGGYVRDGATALLLFAVCLTLDPKLSLLACAALPLTLVPLARLLKRLRKKLKAASVSRGALGHLIAEGLQGLPSIQVDGLQAREAARFHAVNREALAHQLDSAQVRSILSPLMELAAAAGLCAMLIVAATSVAHGTLSGERLSSLLAAALLLAQPLKSLGKVGHLLVAGEVSLARVEELLALSPDVRPGAEVAPFCGELELRAVSFRYAPEGPDALAQLDLTIRRGERVAVVGHSGAGKSTLFQLLLGLRTPQKGELFVDGQPLSTLDLDSLRRELAWLGQEPFLFDGSVADNIALGDEHPDPARLARAAERAHATAFIARAGGFDAPVGERGRRFSGGERQRLCIARAFYQDAPLLLLDEPTSSLDPQSEQAVQSALRELLRDRTVLLIAHRLTTVRDCDRAVVLENGRAVEDGPPEALLVAGGPFAALFGARPALALLAPLVAEN